MQEISNNKLISVVIPAFNAAKYIKATINSIIQQSYTHFEVLVIDDGSTDNTKNIVQSILDPRLSYHFKQNEGVSIARNFGLAKSNGAYIVFFDADDLMASDFLEKRWLFLSIHSTYSCCGGDIAIVDEFDKPISNAITLKSPDADALIDILLYQNQIATIPSNFLFSKNFINENKIQFNPQLSSTADRYFLLQLLQKSQIKRIPKGILYYRVHSNSMSHKITTDLFLDNKLFFESLINSKIIPASIKYACYVKNYYILAGLAKQTNHYFFFIKYLFYLIFYKILKMFYMLKSIYFDPLIFFRKKTT